MKEQVKQALDVLYDTSSNVLKTTEEYEVVKQYIEKLEEAIEIIKNKGIDYHSISAIKQSKDYEDYLDLVKNLITVVFKFTKQEYELLKEAL